MDARLLEAEERHRDFFEALEEGYCVMQLLFDEQDRPIDYRFLEANPAFERHTGLKDAVGKTARELVPDLDASWFEIYGKVALTGEPARFENPAPAMEERWFEVSALRVGRPEWRQVALVFRNITERKRAEQERERLLSDLSTARNRLQNLFEGTPAFVATLSGPDHVFELTNPLYHRLVGHGRELTGKPVREALPEVVEQGFIELLDKVYRTGEPFVGHEQRVQIDRRGDGTLEEAFVTFVYQPRLGANRSTEGIDVFGFEVTEQVLARKKVQALAEELRERADVERKLIGIVSHDLRNPVASILLAASALLRSEEVTEKQARNLLRIQSSAERANRMIRDLLDFSQARLGGGIPIERRAADLDEILRGVVDEVQALHPGRDVRLDLKAQPAGKWDPDRLAQAVENLVNNAIKYSPEASLVRVATRDSDGEVELSVHNENGGQPIPLESMDRLFEPLERGDGKLDRETRSIGLGLYIVREVMRAHGGSVDVKSTAETGTTFTLRFPRHG